MQHKGGLFQQVWSCQCLVFILRRDITVFSYAFASHSNHPAWTVAFLRGHKCKYSTVNMIQCNYMFYISIIKASIIQSLGIHQKAVELGTKQTIDLVQKLSIWVLLWARKQQCSHNSSLWPKCNLKTSICLNSAHLPHRAPAISTFYCATKNIDRVSLYHSTKCYYLSLSIHYK